MFFEEYSDRLDDLVRISHAIGARAEFVQGGGGNTSVKLSGDIMAIKASGYYLSDVQKDRGYAVLNHRRIRDFYYGNDPEELADAEMAGSVCARESTQAIPGLVTVRPSVEAGFHAIMKTYVLHTHSVYANLAACSTASREIAQIAFQGATYSWGWVPYTDPGAKLTFAIRDELTRVEKETGKIPSVILMQNHGIVVHDDNPNVCLAIHADANERLAKMFGVKMGTFPEVTVQEMAGGLYAATTPYLKEELYDCSYTQKELVEKPLYPDQMVFLTDTFYMDIPGVPENLAVASTKTGEMLMNMPQRKALTITQTLTAVFFVINNIKAAGYHLSTMGDAAMNFISNWESEKYRKAMDSK